MLRTFVLGWCVIMAAACGKVAVVDPDAGATDGPTTTDGGDQCGDGQPDDGEDCDEGAANGTASSCCTSACAFVPAPTVCRPSVAGCDPQEMCSGTSGACPDDFVLPDGDSCSEGEADTCCGGECLIGGGSCACALPPTPGLTVTVVESQSFADWAVMDTVWQAQANALGHTATIVPQTALDDPANLGTTDVLIVPSGVIELPPNRIATIQAFVESGRGVFLQGEYQMAYTSNQGFASIVNALGGTFSWTADLSGDLQPVEVVGCTGTTPQLVPAITDFFYGVTGTGTGPGFEVLVQRTTNGQPLGFSFCRTGGGQIMITTDGDFIWRLNPVEFMTNVITRLAHADRCDG